ncbi:hypothetical protein [Legionella hackeliae]|uniref:Uncharacterized protein n=1 Tax=Legionella hackeliae TaxID=449 RepID=A0A0A8URH3_LEGHA|nr:hypothetical protein [Legionella hackeliae]KTD10586.1 hypothetical protein Lhac_2954 [Legionella hackeliae]CEK10091.1 conserved protein of unknown function [Legionella hackeliae]STX46816.1 Uncharacterised protein [Legionella hackeliae]
MDVLKKLKEMLSMKAPYTSSSGHRNAQRSNAVAEVVGEGLQMFNPVAVVPSKFAQSLISAYGLFRSDTHVTEKVIHFLQASISAAQLGLVITLYFQSGVCDADLEGDICKAIFLCELLYKGTLLVGWVPSEMSQDPVENATTADPENDTGLTI